MADQEGPTYENEAATPAPADDVTQSRLAQLEQHVKALASIILEMSPEGADTVDLHKIEQGEPLE